MSRISGRRVWAVGVLTACLAGAAAARGAWMLAPPEVPGASLLPASQAGQVAREFMAMINDGSAERVREFETAHRAAARLAETPVEERAQRIKAMHEDFGELRIEEVIAGGADSLVLVAKARDGRTVVMDFGFEDKTGKLDGVILDVGENAVRPVALTPDRRRALVEKACALLDENYVFPEVAKKMTESVRGKLASGAYDGVAHESALARRLTEDFQAVSKDKHLRIGLAPARTESPHEDGPDEAEMARENYAFRKVERLEGNIGYLRFDAFVPTDGAKATASAAMAFLSHCDAIVFDMRYNGGGSPEMIRFITSYLYESPTHLNDMIDREGKVVEEFWTLKDVPGTRIAPGVPVFVLTSRRTFSGAEEFSYNLKNLKRATLVGETTGGGAHPIRGERLDDRMLIRVPFMRANNPISKTNWEGTGVEPDVKVAADKALDTALDLARAAIQKSHR